MNLLDDLRFGARMLLKKPWTTGLIVLLLAAGIGVNTTVFTLVNAVLIRGLPYEDGERILYLEGRNLQRGQDMASSLLDFLDWRAQTKSFESLAAYRQRDVNLADDETAPERARAADITVNGFEVLRVLPQLGRGFLQNESEAGAAPVLIIGNSIWQTRYGGAEDVIGKTLRVDQKERTIIGVMPAGFRFPTGIDVWIPLVESIDTKRDDRQMGVYGRLASDASPGSAQVEMSLIGQRLQREHPETNKNVDIIVETFNENFNGGQIRSVFLAMSGAVAFVLLIACANVANIQLARAIDRAKEISVRAALGAGKMRIFRQLLAESMLLSFAGGALGFAFSWGGVAYFDRATLPMRPYWIDFTFDAAIFGYLLLVCLSAGILFGLAPALHAVKRDLTESLKEGRGQTTGSRTRFFASAMVAGEVALALVLLVGAGLMMLSFWHVYKVDLGANVEGVISAGIQLPESQYPEATERFEITRRILESIRALPDVVAATDTSHEPSNGANGFFFDLEGSVADSPDDQQRELYVMTSPGYFDFFEAAILQGRDFGALDTPDSPKTAIVNRRFAEKYWPNESPMGKRLLLRGQPGEERTSLEIVGVSSNIMTNNRGEFEPIVYRSFTQDAWQYRRLLIRSQGDPAALAPAMRRAVADIDPDLPVFDVATMEERLIKSRWPLRLFGSIFVLFAAIALTMSAAGIYGLVSYSVGRRTPEFGIRMALGAGARDIRALVLKQGMARVAIGIALGIPAAYFGAQILESVLSGVKATDPVVLGTVALFFLSVAGAACWLPAQRAASVSPNTALRHE